MRIEHTFRWWWRPWVTLRRGGTWRNGGWCIVWGHWVLIGWGWNNWMA